MEMCIYRHCILGPGEDAWLRHYNTAEPNREEEVILLGTAGTELKSLESLLNDNAV